MKWSNRFSVGFLTSTASLLLLLSDDGHVIMRSHANNGKAYLKANCVTDTKNGDPCGDYRKGGTKGCAIGSYYCGTDSEVRTSECLGDTGDGCWDFEGSSCGTVRECSTGDEIKVGGDPVPCDQKYQKCTPLDL